MRHRRVENRSGAGRRVFTLSILFHVGLLLSLSPLLLVAGDGSDHRPAVFCSDVVQLAQPAEDRSIPDAPPPEAAAELAPAILEELPDIVEPPAFEPLREVRPLTAEISIPATRSVLARPKKENPPPRAAPPPPVRASAPVPPMRAVSVRTQRPAGPSRKAAPVSGNAKPRYPARAMHSGIEGLTLLVVSVGPDGSIFDVRVKRSSGSVILDREAVRAVKTWRFRPALELGRAVASKVAVPIRFKLR